MTFQSTHKLDFLTAAERPLRGLLPESEDWIMFKVGTCHGLFRPTAEAYEILAVINTSPGNGHFDDVMEWFENSCRRDGKKLRIKEFIFNRRFKQHLIQKRGFAIGGKDDVVKTF